jgi:hypothetical protein
VLAGRAGEQGLIAFVKQKRFKLREEIVFYADEGQRQPIFRVKARRVLDLGARYDVFHERGGRVGAFGKAFAASLARSAWVAFDPGESRELLRIRERGPVIAIIRRVWEILPWVGASRSRSGTTSMSSATVAGSCRHTTRSPHSGITTG